MKIRSIAAICKKAKHATILDLIAGKSLTQYVTTGAVVYPLYGLPELDEESLLTMFDVPRKDVDKWTVRRNEAPSAYNFEDVIREETLVERSSLSIVVDGRTLIPLDTSQGVTFIDRDYLAPMGDVMPVLELYERKTDSGDIYIVAKAGMMLQAIIMPYRVISPTFVKELRDLVTKCFHALEWQPDQRKEATDE